MGKTDDLKGEVREQLLFLREMGVEFLKTSYPEREKPVQAESGGDEPVRFVPDATDLIPARDAHAEPASEPKSGILQAAKLENARPGGRMEPAEEAEEPRPSPGSEKDRRGSQTEGGVSLFGDLSERLPEAGETLEDIRSEIGADCSRCGLCEERTQVVNSKGRENADLMFIGEAPGADEDAQGAPFVGRAGQLLTKIIEAIDLSREDVFIGNINRCRPPGNRRPKPEEVGKCKPFILREIAVVKPEVIVVLGNTACQNLLGTTVGITKLRGRFSEFFGVKVMPTFHPAYLLRDPRKKREVWEDMKLVRKELENGG